jgi:hypothetical protein
VKLAAGSLAAPNWSLDTASSTTFQTPWAQLLAITAGLAAILALLSAASVPDLEYECNLAADVAAVVAPGVPLHHNIDYEWIGDYADHSWRPNCSSVFLKRGLKLMPGAVDPRNGVGVQISRPLFQDTAHATVSIEQYWPTRGRGLFLTVERRGGHWAITNWRQTGKSWPTVHSGIPLGLSR